MTNKLSEIIPCSKNTFTSILLKWGDIAGKTNREIMIPLEFKNKVLTIGVPNGMVSKTALRFKKQMIENISRQVKKNSVLDLKFVIDASKFPSQIKEEKEHPGKVKIEISKEELSKKTEEIIKLGVSSNLAKTFAEIELLKDKREKN
ncbi:MAG: DciA family protein [bacterium]